MSYRFCYQCLNSSKPHFTPADWNFHWLVAMNAPKENRRVVKP